MTGREKLQEAAGRLFVEHGFGGTAVSEILLAAGLQPPSLYHHFGDKEGLYVAWTRHMLEGAGPALRTAGRMEAGLAGRLEAYGVALWHHVPAHLVRARFDIAELARPESREALTLAWLEAVVEPLASIFLDAARTGETGDPHALRAAEAYLGAFEAVRRAAGAQSPPNPSAAWLAELFTVGLGARRT